MPYAYVDPATGEIYPIETTAPNFGLSRRGRCGFSTKTWASNRRCAPLCSSRPPWRSLADAWWFYHWKIKKPLAILNASLPRKSDRAIWTSTWQCPQRRRAGQAVPVL